MTVAVTARQCTEEAQLAERVRRFEERRDAYTAMLCLSGGYPQTPGSSRQFHTLLKDALHRIRDGVYTEHERDQLEEARRDHRDRYAEAQMIVPERVLDASRAVNEVLAATDAAVKRLDRGLTRDGESAEETLLDLKEAEPRLAAMRRLMRADLGVTE
jgi:ribosome-associated translation inhibitor RaiA